MISLEIARVVSRLEVQKMTTKEQTPVINALQNAEHCKSM